MLEYVNETDTFFAVDSVIARRKNKENQIPS